MRKALAILLIAVLAIVPCAGVNASQVFASDQAATVAHVDHGHADSAHSHAHDEMNGAHDQRHHGDPTDCVFECDSTAAQVTKSEELNKVVLAFVSVTIAYFAQLASVYLIAVPGIDGRPPALATVAEIPQAMSVLERTTRLRN